jgi:hypothetical protein
MWGALQAFFVHADCAACSMQVVVVRFVCWPTPETTWHTILLVGIAYFQPSLCLHLPISRCSLLSPCLLSSSPPPSPPSYNRSFLPPSLLLQVHQPAAPAASGSCVPPVQLGGPADLQPDTQPHGSHSGQELCGAWGNREVIDSYVIISISVS